MQQVGGQSSDGIALESEVEVGVGVHQGAGSFVERSLGSAQKRKESRLKMLAESGVREKAALRNKIRPTVDEKMRYFNDVLNRIKDQV